MTTIQKPEDLFSLFRKQHLFERFGLQKVGLFGSLARGERFNDIDLLIEDEVDYKKLLELKKVLENETGYKVDIVQRKYAEPVILFRALKEIRYAAFTPSPLRGASAHKALDEREAAARET